MNDEIRAREVRLIDENGEQLGVRPFRDALRIAQEKGLDLVNVAPTAKPIVCRIMDYGKFKYEQSKKDREARKKQHIINVKELTFSPNIEPHDLETKSRSAIQFLKDGDRVKVTVRFRGREVAHSDRGRHVLTQFYALVQDLATIDREPKLEGRNMIMFLNAKKQQS
ncbi:MAG: Translation initiation factor IF-3 [Firmicutes bacterium]|nr:Translation initiation factor IF-3 [Bacillota bacterium]MBT9151968.1 Translation initiation factor IF-3 [Bacillota bacterium]MBT9157829.1 Translation initiation factor IF-3 [Bacillota bacterium]